MSLILQEKLIVILFNLTKMKQMDKTCLCLRIRKRIDFFLFPSNYKSFKRIDFFDTFIPFPL